MPIFSKVGNFVLTVGYNFWDFIYFLYLSFQSIFYKGIKFRQVLIQMKKIGVDSVWVVILTGILTGLSLTFQTYFGFSKFGPFFNDYIGSVVALGMTRELGPVMAGLMVVARVGSSMAAEIGTMKITEQIDALKTLNINPFNYLVVPRIVASILVMPFLTLFAVFFGILGGYFFCIYVLSLNPENYVSNIFQILNIEDVAIGLLKSFFFGLVYSSVASYCGYRASGGAKGVGEATTRSVVSGSFLILVVNYLLSYLLFQAEIG